MNLKDKLKMLKTTDGVGIKDLSDMIDSLEKSGGLNNELFKDLIAKDTSIDKVASFILLAIALGSEERCQEDIDKIYSQDENKYFYFYNKSGIGKTGLFDKFTIATSERIKKCYGIIMNEEVVRNTNQPSLVIQKLIKKGYKSVYTFHTHKRWSMLEEFILWYKEKNKGLENISGVYLDYCFYILIYLSFRDEKTLLPTHTVKVVENHLSMFVTPTSIDIIRKLEKDPKNDTNGYKEMLDRITFKNQNSTDVSFVFENIKLLEEIEILKEESPSLTDIHEQLASMPFGRITNVLNILMDMFGISSNILREVELGNERLELIAKYIFICKNASGLTEREAEILLVTALVFYAISEEYKTLRNGYYEGLKTKLQEKELAEQKERTENERKLLQSLSDTESELKSVKLSLSNLEESNKTKSSTIKKLEKDNARIVMELEKAKENKKELQFLRNFYFRSQQEESKPLTQSISMDVIKARLNTLKGVLVGGHPNLTKKLKEVLPNYDFVSEAQGKGRNLTFIRNRDIVFFSAVHDNHSLYYKVMEEVEKSTAEITTLEKYQNLDLLLSSMYEQVVDMGILSEG